MSLRVHTGERERERERCRVWERKRREEQERAREGERESGTIHSHFRLDTFTCEMTHTYVCVT